MRTPDHIAVCSVLSDADLRAKYPGFKLLTEPRLAVPCKNHIGSFIRVLKEKA